MEERLLIDVGDDHTLVMDSQEVEHVLKSIGIPIDEYATLLVLAEDGEYKEVWGVKRYIPSLYEKAYRIL